MRLIQDINKEILAEVKEMDELLQNIESLLDEKGHNATPILNASQKHRLLTVSERLVKAGR